MKNFSVSLRNNDRNRMKKLIVIMGMLGLMQSVAAEVYSCGPGCYTSSPSRGGARASLGNRIGSYTSVPAPKTPREQPAVAAPTAAANVAAPARARTVAHQAAPSIPRPAAAAMPTVAAPRISTARSSGRRTILEQELNNERNALAAAQRALVSGRAANGQADAAHQARVRQLESAVLDRQQNIQALQRELSRM